jgi:hypothetical protein
MNTNTLRAFIQATLGSTIALAPLSTWAGTVSYNTFNHDRAAPSASVSDTNTGDDWATDGWLRSEAKPLRFAGYDSNNDPVYVPTPVACHTAGSYCGDGISTGNVTGETVPWVGNDPRTDASFNYVGTHHLNWTAVLNSVGDGATVSHEDSFTQYGIHADLDVSPGGWYDDVSQHGGLYDMDIGLFRSSVTQTVTLSAASLGPDSLDAHYGFTIFEGQDTTTSAGNHHGYWNNVSPATAQAVGDNANPITPNNPFGFHGLTRLADDVNGNSVTFTAEAGKVYTIFLGGFQDGNVYQAVNDYKLTITSVPLPAGIWLLGSALAGMGVIGRRKQKTTA